MALYNTGTFVVQGGSSGKSYPQSWGQLKSCAAKAVGGENQPYYLAMAEDGLKRAIDKVNMRHVFRFGSAQGSSLTLVDGTDTLLIADGTFAIQEVQLLDTAGDVYKTLEYVPWGQFNSLEGQQDATGTPEFWTARNSFDNRTIEVYPVPDAQAAAKFTAKITYYTRIVKPTQDSDVIDAPQELGEVICAYAEAHILRLRRKNNPALAIERKREADQLLADFVHSTEREPTETLQWSLGPAQTRDYQFDPLS